MNLNRTADYRIDFTCADKLLSITTESEVTYFNANEAYQIFNYLGFYKRKAILLSFTPFKENKLNKSGFFYVYQKPSSEIKEIKLNPVDSFLTARISRTGNPLTNRNKDKEDNYFPSTKFDLDKIQDCGQIDIYHVNLK